MILAPQQNQREAEHDHARSPSIGRKRKGVGFESLAFILGSNAAQRAGTPPVDHHGNNHYAKRPNRRLDVDPAEEQAHNRFVNYPGAGHQEQSGLDEGGKILNLAMAVLMI